MIRTEDASRSSLMPTKEGIGPDSVPTSMTGSGMKSMRRLARQLARIATSCLPRRVRFAAYRNLVKCDDAPSDRLVLKLAETREELEACFRLLHDAYVSVGFMKPDPSGMRVTLYHALPTTTTLLAKFDGKVVGTLSLIRQSAMGFPMQKIFSIDSILREGGNIAEVSALAVDRSFQAKGGVILFPLIKFMYEYSRKLFDTRHLVIAVNPRHIAFYESILFFRRLKQHVVPHYGFVNGAPAVGAHLDLDHAPRIFKRCYDGKEPRKNLYRYFTELRLPNIVFPDKRYFTTNDPVMTPDLLDYFFNQRTQVFARLSGREKLLLHSIYDLPAYKPLLPPVPPEVQPRQPTRRRHRRFSVSCPAVLAVGAAESARQFPLTVIECSMSGFRARSELPLPLDCVGEAAIDLGQEDHSVLRVTVVRKASSEEHIFVLKVGEPDLAWRKFVNALCKASTHSDLGDASRFLE